MFINHPVFITHFIFHKFYISIQISRIVWNYEEIKSFWRIYWCEIVFSFYKVIYNILVRRANRKHKRVQHGFPSVGQK